MKPIKYFGLVLILVSLPMVSLAADPFYDPRCNLCGVTDPRDGIDATATRLFASQMSNLLCLGKNNRSCYVGHGVATDYPDVCDLNEAVGKLCPPKNGTVFSMCCNTRHPGFPFRMPNNAQQIANQTHGFAIGLCSDFDGMFTIGPMRVGGRCAGADRSVVDIAEYLSIYQYCSNGDIREKRLNPNSVRSYLADRGIEIKKPLPRGGAGGGSDAGLGCSGDSCSPPWRKSPSGGCGGCSLIPGYADLAGFCLEQCMADYANYRDEALANWHQDNGSYASQLNCRISVGNEAGAAEECMRRNQRCGRDPYDGLTTHQRMMIDMANANCNSELEPPDDPDYSFMGWLKNRCGF